MGEDVDFYTAEWGKVIAKAHRASDVRYLRDVRVVPSCRRYDQWSTWRILVETNPAFYAALFEPPPGRWLGWYRDVPR